MVQAGDPESRNAQKHAMLGAGGPGYTIPAEFVYPKYFHKRGALSAARQGDPVNPDRKSSGSQFYIVTGKKYNKFSLQDLEQQLDEQQEESIFQRLCAQNRDTIMRMQSANDSEGMERLRDELVAQMKDIVKKQGPFRFSKEQVDAYLGDGGTPFLDDQYTVFGEVVEGMKVVDKIERAATDVNDRPLKDVRILTMEIIN
jgi:cyclophilin family peptidyl-prolyl cis-trans isomerase